jgi:hypothetical protein
MSLSGHRRREHDRDSAAVLSTYITIVPTRIATIVPTRIATIVPIRHPGGGRKHIILRHRTIVLLAPGLGLPIQADSTGPTIFAEVSLVRALGRVLRPRYAT